MAGGMSNEWLVGGQTDRWAVQNSRGPPASVKQTDCWEPLVSALEIGMATKALSRKK